MNVKNSFFKLVQQANNILITGHINPDGDSIGSSFGLALALKNLGKNVKIIKNDDFPTNLEFIYRDDLYYNDEFNDSIDLFIAVDSGDIERIGDSVKYFNMAKSTANIDHHITNTHYADINIVLEASSACEIVTELCIDYDVIIPEDAATYLYLGILTDTFRFVYESSTSTTLRTAAALLDINANKKLIHDNLYDKLNTNLLLFQADVIKNSTRIGNKIIVAMITKDLVKKYDLDFDKTSGIVSLLRTIDGIEVSAIVQEDEPNRQKLSFRSQEFVDVSKIAIEFGGGGHVRASGANYEGTLDEVFDKVVKRMEKLYEDGDLSR